MGVSSKDWYVKHFASKNTGSTGTSADDCGTGTKDTGIWTLGTAKTEFHDRVTFCCVADTGCFSGNKALVVDDVQDSSFYKLCFHDRCNNFYKWFSWEYNSSLRNCIDITCEFEVS